MLLQDVQPFPVKDQWWASRVPLMLYRITIPGSEICCFKCWDPDKGIDIGSIVMPMLKENWVWLSFEEKLEAKYLGNHENLRTGDAFLERESGLVFFIGEVERSKGIVTVLSDCKIPVHVGHSVFQRISRGPEDPAENPPTAYERIAGGQTG